MGIDYECITGSSGCLLVIYILYLNFTVTPKSLYIMIVFIIAITLNCIAILGLAANAILDVLNVRHAQDPDLNANLIGVGYILTVGFSFFLFNNGNVLAATVLSCFAASPVVLLASLLLLSAMLKAE